MNNIVEKVYLPPLEECKITIMGLGYVGIEVALGFGSNSKNLLNNKSVNRNNKIRYWWRRINELINHMIEIWKLAKKNKWS